MSREVLEAMWPYMTSDFGNASSVHDLGHSANVALDQARSTIAQILNCHSDEITFTSGGTEANNYAIKGCVLMAPERPAVVTSPIEHEAVLEPLAYLRRFHGTKVRTVPVDDTGRIVLPAFAAMLNDDVALVSIQYANSEVGTVQDIAAIAGLCHSRGVLIHTDAVQAGGLLPLDVQALGVDFLSMSAHKFGGPKGVGLLYRRNGTELEPLIHGGGQEDGRRSGTSNVAGAVGMAAALSLAERSRVVTVGALSQLRNELIASVLSSFPNALLTGNATERLANHASFVLGSISGESLVVDLAASGFAVSSGSACAAGKDEPSYVLRALGIADEIAQTAVRFTLGRENTSAEIAALTQRLQLLA